MRDDSVGMIGLGLLGIALAERFGASGLRVVGYDVDPARRALLESSGGTWAPAPANVAECGRIVLSLPDSHVVAEVIGLLQPSLRRGTIVVDTTTGDPDEMQALGEVLSARGVSYLDATVGGSSVQARNGDVIVMVGGAEDAYRGCRDLFDSFARQTFHVGPCGSGARMKLVVNLVLGLHRAVLAEGLAFARSLQLDLQETLGILRAGPTWSRVMEIKGQKMLDEDFAVQARLSQHRKDVELMLAAAERTGAVVPFSRLHAEVLRSLEAAGFGNADNSAVIKAFDSHDKSIGNHF